MRSRQAPSISFSEPRTRGQGGHGSLAGVDRPVVEHQHDGPGEAPRPRTVTAVQHGKQGHEVGTALGGRGVDDQCAGDGIEHAHHGLVVTTMPKVPI